MLLLALRYPSLIGLVAGSACAAASAFEYELAAF